jgi:hydrogenase expression/formation protein HypE
MSGAQPLYLSVGFVLEEGLPLSDFHRILCSMEAAANQAGVRVVTGDTKVVGKGHCDKIFINTSGVGVIPDGLSLSSACLQPGDKILLSGTVADHGMAIMTTREGLSFNSRIDSDSAALNGLVNTLIHDAPGLRTLRDPTRGGIATTLNEFASASQRGIKLVEDAIPIHADVAAACEILGIDPMYVANEGKLIAVVPGDEADAALRAARNHPLGEHAAIIGEIVVEHAGTVAVKTPLGTERIVDMPIGEQLPRIC